MLIKFNLSKETRTGLYFVLLYLALILFFSVLALIFKDGWILVPVSIITIFPFLPIILGFIVLITGNEQLLLLPTILSSLVAMTIGGILNTFVLFLLGYLISKIFRRKTELNNHRS